MTKLMSDTIGVARLAGIVLAISVLALQGAALARSAPESFADLAEKLLPSVVNISTTQLVKSRNGQDMPQFPPGSPFEEFFKEFFERQNRPDEPPGKARSLGSGFIIDSSGLIVTNNHVIDGAEEITVNFQDKTSLEAEVVGRDARTDLALLRVKSKKKLPAVNWGASDTARVGDWVLAIGNPFGLGGTVTAGIISAHHRDIQAGPYDDFIQTDASINKGNSGGPLFNRDGKVVGINSAIFSTSGGSIGIGFAIPSNRAEQVIAQLKAHGKARRGWLGVHIQTVTEEIAQGLGLKEARGALVSEVMKDGPAEAAKFQSGDVILEFDGKPVKSMRQLPWMVAQTEIGKKVPVVVWRKGKEVTIGVKLGELPEQAELASRSGGKSPAPKDEGEVLGLKLASLDDKTREKYELAEGVSGVAITGVARSSEAAEKGLRAGQVIVKIGQGQKTVSSPAQVIRMVKQARKDKLKKILLLLDASGSQRFIALSLVEKKKKK